ncbi:hypothetical protein S7711_10150 [Stachybotrys chartarum IBT 7711]|uniref:PiggyBac transposable element-derived protein domain-containing protein n=1 Tax=Stachybotrys chartarum (strain CBS 109288 / IBT 7711) TaxID=1280523 RepID=A0A084B1B5_STACB|nr:hypothetical protein S7711_10150 [Stachybotrys chartarum IBT 7711]
MDDPYEPAPAQASVPDTAFNSLCDNLVTTVEHCQREQGADSTVRPKFKPTSRQGPYFLPMALQPREAQIRPLPPTALQLFLDFVPGFLVDRWVANSNIAAAKRPGLDLAVDELIVGFTGRTLLRVHIPNKPTPTGLKFWAIAQQGYFLGWLPHRPGSTLGPAAGRKVASVPKKKIRLNPTQSVVPALVKLLPQCSYHVFLDNLFSSPKLFLALREEGHGATGIARTKCDLYRPLVEAKKLDNAGKGDLPWGWLKTAATPDTKVCYQ